MTPMYRLPADDAPLSEWLRPVSGKLITRRVSSFSNQDAVAGYRSQGFMAQRMKKLFQARLRKSREAR